MVTRLAIPNRYVKMGEATLEPFGIIRKKARLYQNRIVKTMGWITRDGWF